MSPDRSAPRLRMEAITKRFGATLALSDVSLEAFGGQVLSLVGENGAGKSTLMKVLSGAYTPDSGRMFLDGAAYRPPHPLEARRSGVAMIYQELSLAPHLSVMENIVLGMEPRRGPVLQWRRVRETARLALQQLGRGDIPLDLPVSRLSIAEQQLVEIARAVAVGCKVLVLDEPTSSLTQKDIVLLFELIRRLKSQGHAIIYISHFLEEVTAISDRFEVLRDGRSVGGGATAGATHEGIISLMVGRQVADLYPRSKRAPGEVVLLINRLAGHEKPLEASLELRAGEVLGIAGLMGSGRTELLQTIFGLRQVRSGEIRLGAYIGPASPAQRLAQGAGLLSEDRKREGLALNLSIADNVTLSRHGRFIRPSAMERSSRQWIDRLGVRCRSPWQAVGDLSGGNQQKVAIARLLHHDVDVLLLDEPTRGIDVGAKALIYKLIDQLACQGKAVLMVSSYLPELMGVCDRVSVMCKGRLGAAHAIRSIDEHQIMLEATGAAA